MTENEYIRREDAIAALDEALRAVAQYLLQEGKKMEFTAYDGKRYMLRVTELKEDDETAVTMAELEQRLDAMRACCMISEQNRIDILAGLTRLSVTDAGRI